MIKNKQTGKQSFPAAITSPWRKSRFRLTLYITDDFAMEVEEEKKKKRKTKKQSKERKESRNVSSKIPFCSSKHETRGFTRLQPSLLRQAAPLIRPISEGVTAPLPLGRRRGSNATSGWMKLPPPSASRPSVQPGGKEKESRGEKKSLQRGARERASENEKERGGRKGRVRQLRLFRGNADYNGVKAAAFVRRSETSMRSDNSDGNAISQAMPRCNG